MATFTRAHIRSAPPHLTPGQLARARRDLVIAALYDRGKGWSQAMIADVQGISRSRVGAIVADVGAGYRDPERYLRGKLGGTPARDPLWLRRLDARKSCP